MCKTQWFLEYSRQNHDAGLSAGVYGSDGDDGVFAFITDGDAGTGNDAPRHRAFYIDIRDRSRLAGVVLGGCGRSFWPSPAADIVSGVVYQLQCSAGILQ
ncbi:hypothetical protein D3C81_1329800 [compost metagenome]